MAVFTPILALALAAATVTAIASPSPAWLETRPYGFGWRVGTRAGAPMYDGIATIIDPTLAAPPEPAEQ